MAPDISIIAVDMNTAGNTSTSCAGDGCQPGTLSAIQTCAEVDVGASITVDVVVDSIPNYVAPSGAGPQIVGFDMDLLYSSNVAVFAADMLIGMEYKGTPGGGGSHNTNATPDSDGDFFMGEFDFSAIGESGKGILARLTLQGVSSGLSPLKLHYTLLDGPPNIYDASNNTNAYTIGTVMDSLLAVHPATCPAATATPTPSPAPTPGPATGTPGPSVTAAPSSTPVVTATPPPGGPDIDLVGVDMDTAGNSSSPCSGQGCQPGTLGSVQSCAEVDPGALKQVDIIVDSVPSQQTANGMGPNIYGFAMDLLLDSSVVQVSVADASTGMQYQGHPTGGTVSNTEQPPDTDANVGSFHMEEFDGSGTPESGEGILIRLTLKGLAPGISTLHLQYSLAGSQPAIYDPIHSSAYYIGSVVDARIAVHPSTCADTPTPTPGATACAGCPVGGAVTLASQTGAGVPWGATLAGGVAVLSALTAGVWFGRRRWGR